ncbi:MAG: hypothetical protein VKL39_16065 [Leptolyngbyaceae bacterium]|nr:hypothetical protein [Leptolyngbyaceae bacterium]
MDWGRGAIANTDPWVLLGHEPKSRSLVKEPRDLDRHPHTDPWVLLGHEPKRPVFGQRTQGSLLWLR